MAARRSYGTGSISTRHGSYYGRWRVGGRLVQRKLGPVRQPGSREGLTRSQAEREMRVRMEQDAVVVAANDRRTVEEVGRAYLHHLEHVLERKPSTIQDYTIIGPPPGPFLRSTAARADRPRPGGHLHGRQAAGRLGD